jgi:CheY-like chemotaxis protein
MVFMGQGTRSGDNSKDMAEQSSASRRILLVDDDDAIRRLIMKVLEPYGYAVTGAGSGKEALEKLIESKPDLILLDYVLPDMDGLILLELIRARLGDSPTPIICLTGKTDIPTKTKALHGVWHAPGEFLPAAERFHLMNELDQFVLTRVLSEYADERRGRVSINISGQSVSNPNTVEFIASSLRRMKIDPRRIIFELTETVFIKSLEKACEVVNEIRALGCTFSLDDFGSGFSSLRYLRSLPVDIVKIDGSFVKNIQSDQIDLTLLRSMNEIAHLLGKRTVGEFVESEEMSVA